MRPLRTLTLPSWRCPSCTNHVRRPFSSSRAPRALGPEHPRFIEAPEPPQQHKYRKPIVKGVLPVPRNIFPSRRGGTSRVTPESLDAVTPAARKPLGATSGAEAARNNWRQRMTDMRRENLRQGLMEMKRRKEKHETYLQQRQTRKREERQKLLDASEREDERLTKTTLSEVLTAKRGILLDPHREARIAASMANVQAKATAKSQGRKEALHDLYVQAREFIVDEKALEQAIDKTFGTSKAPAVWAGKHGTGSSIWATGPPYNIEQLLHRQRGQPAPGMETVDPDEIVKDRIGRIAGELTGGKLEGIQEAERKRTARSDPKFNSE